MSHFEHEKQLPREKEEEEKERGQAMQKAFFGMDSVLVSEIVVYISMQLRLIDIERCFSLVRGRKEKLEQ